MNSASTSYQLRELGQITFSVCALVLFIGNTDYICLIGLLTGANDLIQVKYLGQFLALREYATIMKHHYYTQTFTEYLHGPRKPLKKILELWGQKAKLGINYQLCYLEKIQPQPSGAQRKGGRANKQRTYCHQCHLWSDHSFIQ